MSIVKNLDELASIVGGAVEGDGAVPISDVASFDEAGPGEITFFADAKELKRLEGAKAGAVIVKPSAKGVKGVNLLLCENPLLAFARVLDIFRPLEMPPQGVHPDSAVHAGASLGEGVSVGPFAVVEEGASVGPGAVLYPGVYIGRGACVGTDAVLYPGVSVRDGCVLGDRVIVHSNAVIGSDGYGYARVGGRYHKIPQRGIVRVGDDVEIGACVAIDRATIGETSIGRGTKIDNLVQIAHNVKVGEDCAIVSQTGIAGSTTVGDKVQLGGQAGLAGHIEVGDGVMVGAKSGVTKDIASGAVVSGMPAIPHGEWLRAQVIVGKLPEMRKKIMELEKRLALLEEGKR
ncbi:MAG: UDP-3-O-(3-hydroxymyristoyl)glucosamine N-acyltransferase [Thermodesulfobacteriota bacterium]|nr:MAG: UDP-3-O-(3-hydroxymyristoyl)glucosamine N-acyltransferase [Thermodesulfobacteriota bacterium]